MIYLYLFIYFFLQKYKIRLSIKPGNDFIILFKYISKNRLIILNTIMLSNKKFLKFFLYNSNKKVIIIVNNIK